MKDTNDIKSQMIYSPFSKIFSHFIIKILLLLCFTIRLFFLFFIFLFKLFIFPIYLPYFIFSGPVRVVEFLRGQKVPPYVRNAVPLIILSNKASEEVSLSHSTC